LHTSSTTAVYSERSSHLADWMRSCQQASEAVRKLRSFEFCFPITPRHPQTGVLTATSTILRLRILVSPTNAPGRILSLTHTHRSGPICVCGMRAAVDWFNSQTKSPYNTGHGLLYIAKAVEQRFVAIRGTPLQGDCTLCRPPSTPPCLPFRQS
jgi:hypothetical protein